MKPAPYKHVAVTVLVSILFFAGFSIAAGAPLRGSEPAAAPTPASEQLRRSDANRRLVSLALSRRRPCRRNCTPTTTTSTTTTPTTATTPTTTTTTTTTTTPTPPVGSRVGTHESGDFRQFDQTNAAPTAGFSDPSALSVVTERAYDGSRSARARTAGGAAGANKFSRAIYHNLGWGAGTDVWYGCAVYLPFGFYAAQQGQIDLMRWDNWVDDPSTTDRGGIVLYGPPAAGQAFLIRARLGSNQSELVGPFRISEGQWHWVEVHQRFSAGSTSDLSEVYLDGNLVGRSTARNWNGRPARSIRYGLVALADDRQSNPLALWFDRASVSPARLGPA